ncbi:hypothetical protein D2V93_09065 [Flagellimonas taeanensis]|uniref:hypothetical protein n=1 Tax=Flavobacteriaceae TaxID=49546 RepID=UPI000E69BA6F|nr:MULTISPECIES: hypothetical protein [Allomuricauda]MDC6385713.1 hypothetical protein [Muricauda sp. SK9]RIV50997.1 hypothetical protein D2V93_09065 [Allomuricauda taeanensis]
MFEPKIISGGTKKRRFRFALVLGTSFLLILAANLIDYKYLSNVRHNVNSVYNDRVVAQDYIYQLSNLFYQKQLSMGENGSSLHRNDQNDSIDRLLFHFSKTELTRSEAGFFFDLQKNHGELMSLETVLSNGPKGPTMAIQQDIRRELQEIRKNLDDLESVQFTEGGQMTQNSNRSLGMNAFLSKMELAFLIVNGVVLLYMVLLGTNLMRKVN